VCAHKECRTLPISRPVSGYASSGSPQIGAHLRPRRWQRAAAAIAERLLRDPCDGASGAPQLPNRFTLIMPNCRAMAGTLRESDKDHTTTPARDGADDHRGDGNSAVHFALAGTIAADASPYRLAPSSRPAVETGPCSISCRPIDYWERRTALRAEDLIMDGSLAQRSVRNIDRGRQSGVIMRQRKWRRAGPNRKITMQSSIPVALEHYLAEFRDPSRCTAMCDYRAGRLCRFRDRQTSDRRWPGKITITIGLLACGAMPAIA